MLLIFIRDQTRPNNVHSHCSLTNYEQLVRQLPLTKKVMTEVEELRLAGESRWMTLMRGHAGPLFSIDWHRVVLDEAHHINNRHSKSEYSTICPLLDEEGGQSNY